jgi:hypothetical protein
LGALLRKIELKVSARKKSSLFRKGHSSRKSFRLEGLSSIGPGWANSRRFRCESSRPAAFVRKTAEALHAGRTGSWEK